MYLIIFKRYGLIWSFIAEIDEVKDTCPQKHNNLSAPPLRVKTKFDQTAPMENIYMYVNFIYVCLGPDPKFFGAKFISMNI